MEHGEQVLGRLITTSLRLCFCTFLQLAWGYRILHFHNNPSSILKLRHCYHVTVGDISAAYVAGVVNVSSLSNGSLPSDRPVKDTLPTVSLLTVAHVLFILNCLLFNLVAHTLHLVVTLKWPKPSLRSFLLPEKDISQMLMTSHIVWLHTSSSQCGLYVGPSVLAAWKFKLKRVALSCKCY